MVFDTVGNFSLIVSSSVVKKIETAHPMTTLRIPGVETLFTILAAREVPHKIAEIHPVELVLEEKLEVISLFRRSLVAHPELIELFSCRISVAHPGEKHFRFFIKNIRILPVNNFIFVTNLSVAVF